MLEDITQGALRILHGERIVESPLRHTDVDVHLSGFIARVNVRQTFENPYNELIEAVYVFPLPHKAAVNRLTLQVGARRIVGVIKRREDARLVYEQAVAEGKTAGLLEQERPNIFTQSVGNIPPRGTVVIGFSYVDVLPYDLGTYEFHFPLVVGPRYLPGRPISSTPHLLPELPGSVGEIDAPPAGTAPSGTGWSPDTDRVPDASRITPPVLKPGHRTGHDIDLVLELNAGVPIRDLQVINHEAELRYVGESGARITLSPADAIPNKDFVLRYQVAGKKPQMALLSHAPRDDDGCFMLMIQPGLEEELAKAPPREVVFLIDVSGSMRGRPTEKVKETLRAFFDLARPSDTFQIVTFASRAQKLFADPVAATGANIARALNFTRNMRGGGGTEMLQGIRTVLDAPVDPERVRIVLMLTDGYIGNEAEIIEEVGRKSGDQIRVWTVGIGSSPNRFLLDGVAAQGGGMSAVIELGTDPKELVARMVERIHRAQLAHIGVEWRGLSVYETYPRRIPELWAWRPVRISPPR
jgi:Ca-activated chloride channel family protein